jgi:signal transduction histidine kinase
VIKHAGATSVLVQATKEGNKLFLTVEDNGKGFDTALLNEANGMGWINIQNRLDYLKAKLDVQSAPGKGSSIYIEYDI